MVALCADTTVAGVTTTKKKTIADLVNNDFAATPSELKDRRLVVMFFDLSSMQPEDVTRAVDSAKDYINKQMAPADLVASVSLVAGLCLQFLGITPVQALLYTAILYGLTAPVMIALLLHIGNNKKIMGKHTNSVLSNVLGVLTFLLMTAAAVGLVWFQFFA